MSDAVSFRPMTAADIETVLKIEYAAFSHPWTRGIFTDALSAYECWVMFEGDQQVGHGVINVILDEAHLLNITVKPQSQGRGLRSEEHTSELQSRENLVCRLLLEKKKKNKARRIYTIRY